MTKVLIIEDELIIALHLKNILKSFGLDVLEICSNGEDALESYRVNKPDLLFVDIDLGIGITGIEVVEKIKLENEVAAIYLTSHDDDVTYMKVKATNPIAYLKKPFDEIMLRTTIEVAFQQYKESLLKHKELEKKNSIKEQYITELSETNSHLITATWRERELKDELQKTKILVEKQNKNILDSINYAKRIQKAIIPRLENIREDLPHTDWMYKPKDVVSGDFPYYFKKDNLLYYAAIDCTGHGVPGAMMSLIGCLLLNDILSDKEVYSPAEVLSKLHARVVKTLNQDNSNNKAADGMDVAICCYNTATKKLEYSGAHRPLYLVRKGEEIIQYKGGKYPVGGNQYKGKNNYPNHQVDLLPEDVVYFFSDGYPDQFGGENDLKFGPKRIRKLLEKNSDKSVNVNIQILSNSFDDWMEGKKQIDDVLLIGIKFD
jgi:serine phosphatase RsbU (regulator of sigma subunit)